MIPLRMRLENFLSYKRQEILDLRGINIACLWGDNGSGKSALLDAITWALWGKTPRSSSSRDLVHLEAEEMNVELEFQAGQHIYKVKRVYRKFKSPHEQVFLMHWDERRGEFLPITEGGLEETNEKIKKIIRMDYDTFVNSAFLVQGKAGEFTSKPPSERKEVLGKILNLDQYDLLEEKARDKRKAAEIKEAEIKGRLKQLEMEIGKEEGLEEKLEKARKNYEMLQIFCAKLQKEKEEMEKRLWELDLSLEKLKQAQDRIRELDREIADARQEIEEARKRIEGNRKTLLEESLITGGLEKLRQVRQELDELEGEINRLKPLVDKARELEARISEEKGRLESKLRELKGRSAELEREALALESYRLELERVEEELRRVERIEEEVEGWEAAVESLREEIVRAEREKDLAREEVRRLGEQLEMLGEAEAFCPLCGQPLPSHRRDELLKEFQRRIEDKERFIEAEEEKIARLEEEKEKLLARVKGAQESLRLKGELMAQRARLEEKRRSAEHTILELEGLKGRIEELEKVLLEERFAPELRAEREALEESLVRLRGYEERRERLIRQERELGQWELKAKDLEKARESLQWEEKFLEDRERKLEEKLRAREEEERRAKKLEEKVAEREEVMRKWEEKERELEESSRRRDEAWEEVIDLERRLRRLEELRLEKEGRERELALVQEEGRIYQELAEAFGKNGVQAMIIENAIPEIEEEANRLLSHMTGGRMDVRFETQKLTQEGKVKETLEIKIADEKGTRDYKLYSGGESFRVDLAIRIALARLLARRARAPLSVLFIDEGFGTQDSEGLDKVVEAINSIRDEFKFILVITHLEELKERFPVRIEVTKTPSGSTAEVVRVW